jgi:CRP-like cAMP-binding protein
MAKRKVTPTAARSVPAFDLRAFLDSAGTARKISKFSPRAVIFSQGEAATDVFYLQEGSIKLSVLSRTGKSAVVATLGPGDFFGEGSLAGQSRRMATAVALKASPLDP